MAYTFGGATTDDITWTDVFTFGATARACLVSGWFYPTTLTATRKYFSCATAGNWGMSVSTTTSELRLITDNTTDGTWGTSGAGITVDNWHFIAIMNSTLNTSSTEAWRCWIGTVNAPPVEITLTETVASAGNFVGSANFTVGNAGTASLAFQGDIGWITAINSADSASATRHPFSLATLGVISNTEALFAYERYVLPQWRGLGMASVGCLRSVGSSNMSMTLCNLDLAIPVITHANMSSASIFSNIAPTINGATVSQRRSPRPFGSNVPYLPRAMSL